MPVFNYNYNYNPNLYFNTNFNNYATNYLNSMFSLESVLTNKRAKLGDTTFSLKSGRIGQMLKEAGYDEEKGHRLTQAAKKRAKEGNWTGYCARHVRLSFEETGLASGEGNRHAYQYANTLSHNKNFREISVANLSKEDLKELSKYDGIVYVYDRKVAKYSPKSGHIEISLGNGTNGSDGITHYIRQGARVFIPVKTSLVA